HRQSHPSAARDAGGRAVDWLAGSAVAVAAAALAGVAWRLRRRRPAGGAAQQGQTGRDRAAGSLPRPTPLRRGRSRASHSQREREPSPGQLEESGMRAHLTRPGCREPGRLAASACLTAPVTGQLDAHSIVVVRPGDCLWTIAERYLGAGDRYPELDALNLG